MREAAQATLLEQDTRADQGMDSGLVAEVNDLLAQIWTSSNQDDPSSS
jgi:hypothetical protein